MKRRTRSTKRKPRAAGVRVSGVTITIPGEGAWHAQTALECARLADRIAGYDSEHVLIGRAAKTVDRASSTLLRMAREFWRLAGDEVALFNQPAEVKP